MPRGQLGGVRHQALVQTVDLLPTIVSALGLQPIDRDEAPLHGHDLLPLIRGERTKVRDYACLGMDVAEFAIRTHLWHLIVPIETDPDEPRSAELFRKPEDRWDQNNVIDQHPEVAEHLELACGDSSQLSKRRESKTFPPSATSPGFGPSLNGPAPSSDAGTRRARALRSRRPLRRCRRSLEGRPQPSAFLPEQQVQPWQHEGEPLLLAAVATRAMAPALQLLEPNLSTHRASSRS